MHIRAIYLTIFSLFLSGFAIAQTIPQNRITDWSKAGYNDSLPTYSNTVNIMNYGGVADGVTPNDSAIRAAILALGSQPGTIYIPAGNYLFNATIHINRDSIVLKGDGSATKLLFDLDGKAWHCIDISGSVTATIVDIPGHLNKGDSILNTANNSAYKAGDYIHLYSNDSNIIYSPWAYRTTGQIARVTRVQGNGVFIDAALRRNYADSFDTQTRTLLPATGVGIECLYIERKDSSVQQTNNINIEFSAYCWVTGVESNISNFAHVAISRSTHIEVRGCYFHHGHSYGRAGKAYGTLVQFTSGDCLIANNIFEHLRHSMLVQLGANGNVFAHNYSFDTYWEEPSLPANAAGDIVCHGDYPYMNLFEGNIAQNIVVDDSHGINGQFNTFFRNRAELYGIFMSNSPASDSVNFVGNEVTNTSSPTVGLYFLNGAGHFEHGNNVKTVITPNGTNNLPERSLYSDSIPGYWPGNEGYPSIGSPTAYNQGAIAAKLRAQNNQMTDCEKNPKYVSVSLIKAEQVDIVISPNPFINTLTINTKENVTYRLYNITGQIVLSGTVNAGMSNINCSNIMPGVYILEMTNNSGATVREKLMKLN